jgi:hypothetical protein
VARARGQAGKPEPAQDLAHAARRQPHAQASLDHSAQGVPAPAGPETMTLDLQSVFALSVPSVGPTPQHWAERVHPMSNGDYQQRSRDHPRSRNSSRKAAISRLSAASSIEPATSPSGASASWPMKKLAKLAVM